jgi:hypothetical protein
MSMEPWRTSRTLSVTTTEPEVLLHDLLRLLETADAEEDIERVSELRMRALSARMAARRSRPQTLPTALDIMLIERVSADLQRTRRFEQASRLCAVGIELAETGGQAYIGCVLRVRSICCHLAAVNLPVAEAMLCELLGRARELMGDSKGSLEAARSFQPRHERREERLQMRALVLYALGRFWNACGRLACASEALSMALKLLESTSCPFLRPDELAVFIAETCIDRGDFNDFFDLYERWGGHAGSADDEKWQLLHAQALCLAGRLTEAEQCLAKLARSVPPPQRWNASWQHAQVLACLNRLGEAETVLDLACDENDVSEEKVGLLKLLIRTRRHVSPQVLGIPPVPAEEPTPELPPLPAMDVDASAQPGAMSSLLARRHERIAEDWGSLANTIYLDLERGFDRRALQHFVWLRHAYSGIESQLIAARMEYLWSTVAHRVGDRRSAKQHSELAAEAFARLGMPFHEWAACRVHCLALELEGRQETLLQLWQRRARSLQTRVSESLAPRDKIYFEVNKWSVADEAISSVCRQIPQEARSDGENWIARAWKSWRMRRGLYRGMERLERLLDTPVSSASQAIALPEPLDEAGRRLEGPTKRPNDMERIARVSWVQRGALRQGAARGIPARRLRRWELPRDLAIVRYIVLPDRVEALFVARAGVARVSIPCAVSRLALWSLVQDVWNHLTDLRLGAWQACAAPLQQIAAVLGIPQIMAMLSAEIRRLVIVPDDVLFNIPFAAIPHQGAPLIEHVSLTLAQELRWLPQDPVCDFRNEKLLSVSMGHAPHARNLPPLTNTEAEVRSVGAATGACMTILGEEQATTGAVKNMLPGFRYAHFACHGMFRAENPHESGLCLRDRWLTIQDMSDVSLQAMELVVLSSCFGADTMVLPGRAKVGLPTAFLFGGAGHVISSLWPLADDSSPALMKELYAAISELGPALGLRTAQRRWLREYPPYVAAAYVLYAAAIVPREALCWWVAVRTWWRRLLSVRE